jgi:hypothetical protein
MSIIDKKYAERYRKNRENADWFSTFVDGQVQVKDTKEVLKTAEDGTETKETVTLKRTRLDLDKLFALADANHVDTAKMKAQRDQKNAPGRIRMTLGNNLRAVAKRRHGLNDVGGVFHEADAEFIGETLKTQNPDGSYIEKPKPEAPAAEQVAA